MVDDGEQDVPARALILEFGLRRVHRRLRAPFRLFELWMRDGGKPAKAAGVDRVPCLKILKSQCPSVQLTI